MPTIRNVFFERLQLDPFAIVQTSDGWEFFVKDDSGTPPDLLEKAYLRFWIMHKYLRGREAWRRRNSVIALVGSRPSLRSTFQGRSST